MFDLLFKNKELINALKIIWILSGITTILVVLAIMIVPTHWILESIPICEYKALNKKCFMCGSTRAFIEILKFNFLEAYRLNKISIYLFFLLLINTLTLIFKNYENS